MTLANRQRIIVITVLALVALDVAFMFGATTITSGAVLTAVATHRYM